LTPNKDWKARSIKQLRRSPKGREAVQGLRSSIVVTNDLAVAIRTLGEELAAQQTRQDAPFFDVAVEGTPRDSIRSCAMTSIGLQARRCVMHSTMPRHGASRWRYNMTKVICSLRVRDDGKGVDSEVFTEGRSGHWGLQGMRERAKLLGGQIGSVE